MRRAHWVMFEIFAPAPLGAILILLMGHTPESLTEILRTLPIFLLISYIFGIVPSLLYAFVIEAWFHNKLQWQSSIILTVLVSLLLGALSGLCVFVLSAVFTTGSTFDLLRFIGIGCLVGLIIGVCLAPRCRAV
jgi:hypothetical protein